MRSHFRNAQKHRHNFHGHTLATGCTTAVLLSFPTCKVAKWQRRGQRRKDGWSSYLFCSHAQFPQVSVGWAGLGLCAETVRIDGSDHDSLDTTVRTTKRPNRGHGNVPALFKIESYLYRTTWDCVVIPRYNEVLIAAENFVKPGISLRQGLYISAVQIMHRCLKHSCQ